MLETFFQKSIETCSTKHDAVSAGLIGMNELDSDECYMAVEIADREEIPIPERFLKEMTNDMLFDHLPSRKEVVSEIVSRARKDDFEFPERRTWATKYDIPVNLQKKLIPNFVKLPRKILKRWKKILSPALVKEIVSIRIKEGRLKARKKEDPLLIAIKNNDSRHLDYFDLEKLTKERFLLVLNPWLKTNDEIKAQIFKTSYTNLLNKAQYFEVLKSWLNNHSYFNGLKRFVWKGD